MPASSNYQSLVCADTATIIASSQTTSPAIDLGGTALAALFMPAAFTGTTIKIQAAPTADGAYNTVTDGAGNDYTLTVAANKVVPIANLAIMASLRFIKLVSGSVEGADRTIILATRPV